MKTLIFVIYDSILNSVFYGQVLQPLFKKLASDDVERAYLISFERKVLPEKQIARLNKFHQKLRVIILKRNQFITPRFLFPEIKKLKQQLNLLERYEIIARGPIAGFIAQHALEPQKCLNLIVQARGLLAEEYKYEHRNIKGLLKYFYKWRERKKKKVECLGFKNFFHLKNFAIEVVSKALCQFLEKEYSIPSSKFVLAHDDIPAKIDPEKVKLWREKIRKQLHIPSDTIVYCFSGSVKSWQCPKLVVDYFKKRYEQNKNIFLLILTFDVKQFAETLNKIFPKTIYHVVSVPHEQIYQFLSASDKGIVFREKNIISYVARPVKAMEYIAAALPIIHNNTVAWLVNRFCINQEFAS